MGVLYVEMTPKIRIVSGKNNAVKGSDVSRRHAVQCLIS